MSTISEWTEQECETPVGGRRPTAKLARIAMLVLVVLLAATACTGRRSVPTSYGKPGSSVEKNFMRGCVAPEGPDGKISNPEAVCKCAYDRVSKEIPFEDFKKINDDLSKEPKPLPEKMESIIASCVRTKG